jgi:hypothetical protein
MDVGYINEILAVYRKDSDLSLVNNQIKTIHDLYWKAISIKEIPVTDRKVQIEAFAYFAYKVAYSAMRSRGSYDISEYFKRPYKLSCGHKIFFLTNFFKPFINKARPLFYANKKELISKNSMTIIHER